MSTETINLTDSTVYYDKDGNETTLSALSEGTMVTITFDDDGNAATVTISDGGNAPGGAHREAALPPSRNPTMQ